MVTRAHIDKVAGRLDSEGRFGLDNRAGVPGKLHRVSVMRSREVGADSIVECRYYRYLFWYFVCSLTTVDVSSDIRLLNV